MPGRRVLITRASKGIGRAVADGVAVSGDIPVGLARTKPDDFPGEFFEVDLADRAATADVLDRVLERGRIDAVVNNVGLARFGRIGSIDLDDLFVTYDVNVRTAVQVVQAVLPRMLDGGWPNRQRHQLDHARRCGAHALRGIEGGAGNVYSHLGTRARADGHHGQRGGAGPHRNGDVPRAQPDRIRPRDTAAGIHSPASRWNTARDRPCDPCPARRRRRLHHRSGRPGRRRREHRRVTDRILSRQAG
jgi:NAD(P)-dependent dehydrogenase (short-subunit alcohol dehydrogenase family)